MKLYLAGVERRAKLFGEIKPPYVLFSFATCGQNCKLRQKVIDCVRSPWCKGFLCDSGAFTYFSKKESKTLKEWDRYIDDYIDFINAYDIHHFFEMDIDCIVGLGKVEEFRRRIEKRTGKQTIPVWHINRGWDYFKRMCDEYDYVSIGGISQHVKDPNAKELKKILPYFIDHAHKTNTKIHGLGFTDLKELKHYKFDSVDSSSWSTASRYGVLYMMKGNAPRATRPSHSHPNKRVDGESADVYNLRVWSQYAQSLDL